MLAYSQKNSDVDHVHPLIGTAGIATDLRSDARRQLVPVEAPTVRDHVVRIVATTDMAQARLTGHDLHYQESRDSLPLSPLAQLRASPPHVLALVEAVTTDRDLSHLSHDPLLP